MKIQVKGSGKFLIILMFVLLVWQCVAYKMELDKQEYRQHIVRDMEIVDITDTETGVAIDLNIDGEVHTYLWVNERLEGLSQE